MQLLLEFNFKVLLKRCIEIKLHFKCLRGSLHIEKACSESCGKVKITLLKDEQNFPLFIYLFISNFSKSLFQLDMILKRF